MYKPTCYIVSARLMLICSSDIHLPTPPAYSSIYSYAHQTSIYPLLQRTRLSTHMHTRRPCTHSSSIPVYLLICTPNVHLPTPTQPVHLSARPSIIYDVLLPSPMGLYSYASADIVTLFNI